MGYSAKVGSFNIDTSKGATETQAITGVGFQPKIVLFWWGGSVANSDTVAGGTYNIGFGAAISSSSRFCVMGISEDAQATSDAARSQNNTEAIRCYTDAATLDGIMDSSSMDADGFTLVVDNQFTQAYRISYLALGGTDLTNVYIGNAQTPVSTGEYSITGVGFQPDALITACSYFTGASAAGATLYTSFGMATGSSNQGVIYGYVQDNQATSNTAGYGYDGECLSGGTTYLNSFVSLDADGFTLNNLQGTTVACFHYICLKGGQYSVGDLTTRTDGNDIAEVIGFQPVAILFKSANRTLSTQDVRTDHLSMSIGAGTSTTNRACAAVWDEDGVTTTETAYANYDSAVYAKIASDDTIDGLMDIKSIDADGFTCVMDDADPSACWATYLAIGAAGEVRIPRHGFTNFQVPGIV